jgi:hypothetical protein
MNKIFKPLDILQSITKRWWITALSMVMGGLFALLLTRFIHPVYESSASFSVTIDYTRTGALSDVQEDQAMRGVGYVITSDEVIEAVVNEIDLQKSNYSRIQFEKDSTLDREEFQWTLRYRSSYPLFAEKVAIIWADTSNSVIQEGLIHAQIVDSATEVLWGLEDCFERSTGQFETADLCGFDCSQDLMNEIMQLSQLIHGEKTQTRGLFAPLAVQMVQQPQYPDTPVRHQKNILTASGIVAGLILSILTQGILYYRGLDFEK